MLVERRRRRLMKGERLRVSVDSGGETPRGDLTIGVVHHSGHQEEAGIGIGRALRQDFAAQGQRLFKKR